VRARALLALALAVAAAGGRPAAAFWDDTGASTLQFLRVGPGARALGMGEAYGPVVSGAESVYWNPGAMARTDRLTASYSHAEMLGLLRLEHAAFALPLRRLGGAMGMSFTFFHQEPMALVTNTNQNIGSFAPHGQSIALAYARNIFTGDDHPMRDRGFFQDLYRRPGAWEPLDHEPEPWTGSASLGAALKFVSETIHDESAWAVALDAGSQFRPVDAPELSMSAVVRNVGTSPKFRNATEALPAEAAFGIAYALDARRQRVWPAFEVAIPRHGKPYGKLGVEYGFPVSEAWRGAVRGGYKTLTAADLGPLTGLSGGIGLEGKAFHVDFAFQPMAVLGEVFRISMGWKFNPPAARRRPTRRVAPPPQRRFEYVPMKDAVEVEPADAPKTKRPRY
jgi:hypothetical protein